MSADSILAKPYEEPSRPAPNTAPRLMTAVPTHSDYYSEERHGPHEYFDLGNFELESGITLPNARLAHDMFFPPDDCQAEQKLHREQQLPGRPEPVGSLEWLLERMPGART